LIDQCKTNQIDVKDQTIKATNKKHEVEEKIIQDQTYADKLSTIKHENEVFHKGVLEYRSQMHTMQVEKAEQQKIEKDKKNPFVAKVN
jgi:hypothetical protein